MKIYCGTDIIEIERIREAIEQLGEKFLTRVYTQEEIHYCEQKGKQKFQHYAVRFAAKEAVFKAISKTLKDKYEISWKDIEILNEEGGRPTISLSPISNGKIENIDISMSHCKEYATATVVAMIKEREKNGII